MASAMADMGREGAGQRIAAAPPVWGNPCSHKAKVLWRRLRMKPSAFLHRDKSN
ncbi:hypothetical protein ACFRU3_45815 [Streptomyces sp. NPDC056910]|uniref:hypothetical protein n=1 Tax=Streptomyces sp. NPDC056910 TaxID=3345964 RepID=UPI0036765B4E